MKLKELVKTDSQVEQHTCGNGNKSVQTATILVVDDEPAILDLVVRFLRRHGCSVLAASGPKAALLIAEQKERSIDLLLTDIQMPGMNGFEVAHAFKDYHPESKLLYISGYFQELLHLSEETVTGVDFLQKPFPLSSLIQKVEHLLAC